MGTMFDAKKTVKTDTKAKQAEKVEIAMAGLEAVAALDAVIKSLTALKDSKALEVKDLMRVEFIAAGLKSKSKPESFRGRDGAASASCELRNRASTSPLTDDEIALLAQYNIPVQKLTATVDTFVINPDYIEDMTIMSKIEKALKPVKGIPEDLFLKQEGKSKTVVADTAMDILFKTDRLTVETVLPLISVPAIKPKMDSDDLAAAFAIVEKLITPVQDEEEAA
jgi:hypothetical protein